MPAPERLEPRRCPDGSARGSSVGPPAIGGRGGRAGGRPDRLRQAQSAMSTALHLCAWVLFSLPHALSTATQTQESTEAFPTWDRAHPDAAVPARDNAMLAQAHHTLLVATTRPGLPLRTKRCFQTAAMGNAPEACATGDAGDGSWEPDGGLGYRWQPASCRLRYATPAQLRCALAGKRLAFLGDSLVRNLFDGIVHHAGLSRVTGRGYGTKSKQSDGYATHQSSDILMLLHWAPCAVVTDGLDAPSGLAPIAALQWSECQSASVVGTHRPMRSRNLEDLLSGFGIRRASGAAVAARATASRCLATPAFCVTESSGGDIELLPPEVTSLPRSGVEVCMAGYSSTAADDAGVAAKRIPSSTSPNDVDFKGEVRSSWRQLCEPPDVVVFNLGLWQTELATRFSLPAFETALRAFIFTEGRAGKEEGDAPTGTLQTVVLLCPWRVRDAAAFAPPPQDGERPFVLFSDERLKEICEGMRNLCSSLNAVRAESTGEESRHWWPHCSVLSPWEMSYAPHALQRDRDVRDKSDRAWWTDNRHIAPDSDFMGALVQLFLAALQR